MLAKGTARGTGEIDRGQYDEVCETALGYGAMLLIRRTLLDMVGFLPEEHFFAVEDLDYSTAALRAGWKILYVPTFKGYHHSRASYRAGHPVLGVYNFMLNKMIYAQKYIPRPMWMMWKLIFWLYLQVWWPRRARLGCQTVEDYRARVRAARLAFHDHKGIRRVELADLDNAARRLGPTPTWGRGWYPQRKSTKQNSFEAPI